MKVITLKQAKKIRLSKNFTLDEFLISDTALRKGINNDMPAKYLKRIQFLVDTVLQPLRDKFGPIKITSGYRSVALCLAIGSSKHSNHAYGFAVDFKPYNKKIKYMKILKYINKNLEYKELIAEYFPHGWIHVAAQDGNNKRVLKLKDKKHNYKRMTIKQINNIYSKVKVT